MAQGSYDVGPLITYVKKKKYVIEIYHVPTDRNVVFPAFLTGFEDTFTSDWNTVSVFGRMDPIHTFQQTNRSISVSIDIPSADENEAKQNLANVRELTKFLYPTYQNNYNATTISKAPLVRIKFANLIGTNIDGLGQRGLLGKLNGAAVSPDTEVGFFDPGQMLYPKVLKLTLNFDVIHERNPGEWKLVQKKVTKEPDKKATATTVQQQTTASTIPPVTIPAGSKDGKSTSGLQAQDNQVSKPEEPASSPETTGPVEVVDFSSTPLEIVGRPLQTDAAPASTQAPNPSAPSAPVSRIVDDEEEQLNLEAEQPPAQVREPGDDWSVQDILSGKIG